MRSPNQCFLPSSGTKYFFNNFPPGQLVAEDRGLAIVLDFRVRHLFVTGGANPKPVSLRIDFHSHPAPEFIWWVGKIARFVFGIHGHDFAPINAAQEKGLRIRIVSETFRHQAFFVNGESLFAVSDWLLVSRLIFSQRDIEIRFTAERGKILSSFSMSG